MPIIRYVKPSILAALVVAAPLAPAQTFLAGRHAYPQFRVLSGLPGGGYGVLPSGRPGIGGATALTTPIGYTLGGHAAAGLFNTTVDSNPFHLDRRSTGEQQANGTAFATVGGSAGGFRASASVVVLSTALDSVLSLQASPPPFGRLGIAVGVQDLWGNGGASGTGYASDRDASRSIYGAGTYDLGGGRYVSLGLGDRRLRGLFGNVSAPIANRLRAMAEYDTFNVNAGLLFDAGPLRGLAVKGRNVDASVFLGFVRGRYATLGVTLTL